MTQATQKVTSHTPFRSWLNWAHAQNQLEILIKAIITSGNATTENEAMAYLEKMYNENNLADRKKIHWSDFSNAPISQKKMTELKRLLNEEQKSKSKYDHSRYHGIVGHSAIPDLFSGKLISITSAKKKGLQGEQLALFPNGFAYELLGQNGHLKKPNAKSSAIIQRLVADIEEKRSYLAEHASTINVYFTPEYKKLKQKLKLIFKEHFDHILYRDTPNFFEDERLSFLTFMSWAGALAHYKKIGSRPLFREVSVLPYREDVGTGRIDAFEVLEIDGHEPSQKQVNQIASLAEQKFDSIGHVIKALRQNFRSHLKLKISDWKFAVGDSPKQSNGHANVIQSKEVLAEALTDHVKQIKRYLSTTVLSHVLAEKRNLQDIEHLWESQAITLTGEIVYFLPDKLPQCYQFDLSAEEMEQVFHEQIVSNFRSATFKSHFRHASHAILDHTIKLFEGKQVHRAKPGATSQLVIEGFETTYRPHSRNSQVRNLIERYSAPVFLDQTKIIEIVGRKKKTDEPVYKMHLDRLIAALKDETSDVRAARGFNFVTGGKILCLNHSEKSGSMHINIRGGYFKCFGCGAGGHFAEYSIPDDLQSVVLSEKKSQKEHRQTLGFTIDPRHRAIMTVAQDTLVRSVERSKAVDYMTFHRGLSTSASKKVGMGYADERLIVALINNGFSYDELLFYGFLKTSANITESHTTVQLLRNLGFSLEELTKQGYGSRSTDLVPCLPYAMFHEMVTYPLEIDGIINSFYGRSVDPNCPKSFRHRKSKIDGMNHGAWNMYNAMHSGRGNLLVTEACLDGDTFLQNSSAKAVTAIVGVNNHLLFEILAGFNGNITIALDWDEARPGKDGKIIAPTGQRNTLVMAKMLRDYGFKNRIFDFTGGFISKHPDANYKDFNSFWKTNHRYVDVGLYLKPIDESLFDELKNSSK